jgi:hypothetical protein
MTEDGTALPRPPPPRTDGPARYGDRFRRIPATLEVGPAADGDTVDMGVEAPPRAWPTWLTRGAAGVGLVATAAVAVWMGDRDDGTPQALPDAPPQNTMPSHDPPPVAPLDVRGIEANLWDSHGFSYEITLTNTTLTAFDLIDVGPPMSGTELAWDRSLVLEARSTTTVRVDFLVLNCLAATSSTAPMGLRMVVRSQGDAVTSLAQVATVEQAAVIDAAGKEICAQGADAMGIVLS